MIVRHALLLIEKVVRTQIQTDNRKRFQIETFAFCWAINCALEFAKSPHLAHYKKKKKKLTEQFKRKLECTSLLFAAPRHECATTHEKLQIQWESFSQNEFKAPGETETEKCTIAWLWINIWKASLDHKPNDKLKKQISKQK